MDIKRPQPHLPIPADAKLVFKGTIFDVYEWQQEVFDGSKHKYQMLKRPDTASVFPVLPDGKILLIRQEQPGTKPYISAPGGRMDPGEEPLAAAKRELLEETGYEASEWSLWNACQPVHKIDWAVYMFIAKGLKKVSDMRLDAGEKIELMPVTFDEFLEVGIQKEFSEQEIVPLIYQARGDTAKKEELRKLFSLN